MKTLEKWAVTLSLNPREILENRICVIVNYLSKCYPNGYWKLLEMDATGSLGNQLTHSLNKSQIVTLSFLELLRVLKEEGQVIDLDISFIYREQELIKILVQDGVSVDILGRGEILPIKILGDYQKVDINLFLWNEKNTQDELTKDAVIIRKSQGNTMATNVLEKIDLRQLGEQLQQARKQRGMTQAEAAKVIDVAYTTLVAIEKGERRLKSSELIKLARAYGRAVSEFVQSTPVAEPFDIQFRTAYRRSEEDEALIKPTILEFEQLCRNYLELEKMLDAPLSKNYPQEYNVEEMLLESAAESIANAERQRLGLGDRPILRLRGILEQEVGLRIFYLKMPSKSKCSVIYSYNQQFGGCLAINADHPKERQIWSLADGYLHFLAHRRKPVIDYDEQYQRMPESERLAEAFSKYFLMPTSSLRRQFYDIYRAHDKFTLTNLLTLAYYYGVSVQALSYRLQEMELIPSGTWGRLRDRGLNVKNVKNEQQKLGLKEIPRSRYRDLTPIHYQHLAIEAFDQGLITEGKFAKFLGVNRLKARRMAEDLRKELSGMSEENMKIDLLQWT